MVIEEGDDVLLYLKRKKTFLVKAERGKTFHTHKGFLDLGSLIGGEYGVKIMSSQGVEFVALKPRPVDYAFKMARRTQIVYPKDMGLILVYSGIAPGSRVVEAGTGTGALTSMLASHVKPNGRVFSYEVREEFLEAAAKNLKRAGVDDVVKLKNKDITKGIDEYEVDAVILDMATPWLVVRHAYRALKPGRVMASFSPTIEQVQKTVFEMEREGFIDVRTYECLLRDVIVKEGKTRPDTFMIGHTGYMTFGRKIVRGLGGEQLGN